jgi:hypothetical protein
MLHTFVQAIFLASGFIYDLLRMTRDCTQWVRLHILIFSPTTYSEIESGLRVAHP